MRKKLLLGETGEKSEERRVGTGQKNSTLYGDCKTIKNYHLRSIERAKETGAIAKESQRQKILVPRGAKDKRKPIN